MDNTALHTFLFHCPPALRSIVLLGSWDNFARPYPLELDARRGHGIWKGCFIFSDIICDGDLNEQATIRDGLLKMGGTYWYYYKVDGDEECHNPSEPSTTVCPLLPGQRLNVLEVPRERHGRSSSETSAFTRNPKDRFLTPVPPAPPAPSLSDNSSFYPMGPPSPWAPKSATYAPAERLLSPNMTPHARSASASPHVSSTPIFPDFKVLKDMLASKRAASRIRSPPKFRELEIGSPVLVSSTVNEESLIPLSAYRPKISHNSTPTVTAKASRSLPSIRRQFSPLESNPVDPILDANSYISELPANENLPLRRRSHVPTTIVLSEFKTSQGRIRANSADTRRIENHVYPNDPWLSSPRLGEELPAADELVEDDTPVAPTLRHHASHFDLPGVFARPTSSHGSDPRRSQTEQALNKDLPALPSYITPAPLFACTELLTESTETIELPGEKASENMDFNHELRDFFQSKPRSHFSTWSSDSLAYSSTTSDGEPVQSPTFSSLTSSCGDSPQHATTRYSFASTSPPDASHRATVLYELTEDADEDTEEDHEDHNSTVHLSPTPPRLQSLRISRFDSNLFGPEAQYSDTASRRQAICFGLGFQYALPEDETASKTTLTPSAMPYEPAVAGHRQTSLGQLNTLLDEFAFLGDAVI